MVLAIFLCLEVAARIYFLRPYIVIRNAGNDDQAMNYLLDDYARYKGKGPRIACIGSSVMQGYINAYDDKTFPSMTERILRKKYGYEKLRTFNFAVAGNNFGDHLAILNRVLQDKPDLIVHAIHFKLFSTHLNTTISRPENIYYLIGARDFWKYMNRFGVSPKQVVEVFLEKKLERLFTLYGNRNLITHLVTGDDRVATQQVVRRLQESFGFLSEEAVLARLHTPSDHNQEFLWKLLPESLMGANYEICGNFKFSEDSPAWQSFVDGSRLASEKSQPIFYYMTPMNKPFIDEANFFDWNKIVPVYKEKVYHVTRRYNHKLVDYTQIVNPAYFSDTDHLNMAGHQQVAQRLSKDVDELLQSRFYRSRRAVESDE
jgi:lysophospholipase L1-like esterase